ncbi:MAG: serine/threonine protein kinase [Clostridia bacterium]|nr:serine/threonine protein kinase [Clostridia bacterium]
MAAIGEVIDDKYEILKLIGKGGMSRVYLAMDKRLNKQWAVKEIEKRARDKNNEVVIQSAIAEANMIKKLDHPALPRIVDIIDNGSVIYVIMDYIEGEALNKILDSEGAQPEEAVIEWAKQLCEVLDYLHTRTPPIIYRDMKPANIMLRPDGTVKLIDFGIAREYKEHNLADTVNMGTKGYAAPEQFGNAGQTDARTDVYCLGVTLYHLVTGHNPAEPPYEIYPIRHWNPQLSAGLEVIIQKCVQPNPEDRYQSCAELMYALQHYEEYGEEYRAARRKKLRSFIITAAASLVCLCLAFAAVGIRKSVNNSDYDLNMEMARDATDYSDKLEYYQKAIEIKPLELEPYLGLIDVFQEDEEFSSDEEAVLKKNVSTRKAELRKLSDYPDLSYEIGRLYWFSYNSSENSKEGRINSIVWFEDTVDYGGVSYEHYKDAEIYKSIGEFDKNINTKINHGEDTGEYGKYWDSIKSLVTEIMDNEETDLMQLEVCKLAMNAIEDRARDFKRDGVAQDDMQNVYDIVLAKVSEINGSSANKTGTIKEELLSRADETQEVIKRTYKEAESSKDAQADN